MIKIWKKRFWAACHIELVEYKGFVNVRIERLKCLLELSAQGCQN